MSSRMTEITASDGHVLAAYEVAPARANGAALVVLQEIFGVNRHMRAVADRFAAEGYRCVAPALFDRTRRDVALGYDAASIAEGRELRGAIPLEGTLLDVQAAIDRAKAGGGKVGVVGYCWGGSLAFLASTRLSGLDAAVGYYGGMIAQHADEMTRVPTILHFGEHDASIPMTAVATVTKAHPDMSVFVYPAGHGFGCDERADFHPESAALALERTLQFFAKTLL